MLDIKYEKINAVTLNPRKQKNIEIIHPAIEETIRFVIAII